MSKVGLDRYCTTDGGDAVPHVIGGLSYDVLLVCEEYLAKVSTRDASFHAGLQSTSTAISYFA